MHIYIYVSELVACMMSEELCQSGYTYVIMSIFIFTLCISASFPLSVILVCVLGHLSLATIDHVATVYQ